MGSCGEVYAYGNATFHGSGPTTVQPIVAVASPNATGYWLCDAAGHIYSYGSASYYGGSPSGYTGVFTDMARTPNGEGYWLLTSYGEVYTYGNATFYGGQPTGAAGIFVAIRPTPSGDGYWLMTSIGEVFGYGNASFYGGQPTGYTGGIVDLAPTTTGDGYWMVSGFGQVYSYGSAVFHGSSGTSEGRTNGVDKDGPLSSEASCLVSAGFHFVGRYVGGECLPGSPIAGSEVTALSAEHLLIASVFSGAQNNTKGVCGTQSYTQGVSDANTAATKAKSLHQPPQTAIFLDMEANQNGSNYVTYINGWATRLAKLGFQPGVYSSPNQLTVIHETSWAARGPLLYWPAAWITRTKKTPPPNPRTELPFAQLWQYGGTSTSPPVVCGTTVDIDSAVNYYGLWRSSKG